MQKKNAKSSAESKEEPVINIVDRRSSLIDEETGEVANKNIEERLPSYVEQLKLEVEEKDKRLRGAPNAGQDDDKRQCANAVHVAEHRAAAKNIDKDDS